MPSFSATRRAVVDFPLPAGPSIATMILFFGDEALGMVPGALQKSGQSADDRPVGFSFERGGKLIEIFHECFELGQDRSAIRGQYFGPQLRIGFSQAPDRT